MGHILHIDNFGNLITDIGNKGLPLTKESITIEVGDKLIRRLSRTYAEGDELLALIGSSGHLEISRKGGSAADFLNAEIGNEVRVKQQAGGSQ